MKRLHVNVAVENLDEAIRFYSTLFATKPSVEKHDYAKWMLEDPRVNFAITARGRVAGLDHLGIQVEDAAELGEVYDRLSRAERPVTDQGSVTCCYAKSTKSWITDPAGISWETFLTHGDATQYGGDDVRPVGTAGAEPTTMTGASACCGEKPADVAKAKSACCGEKPTKPAFSCCA